MYWVSSFVCSQRGREEIGGEKYDEMLSKGQRQRDEHLGVKTGSVRDVPETELQAGKKTLKGIFQHLFDILIFGHTDRRSLRVWS